MLACHLGGFSSCVEAVTGGPVLRVPGCSFPTLWLAVESSHTASEKAFG